MWVLLERCDGRDYNLYIFIGLVICYDKLYSFIGKRYSFHCCALCSPLRLVGLQLVLMLR